MRRRLFAPSSVTRQNSVPARSSLMFPSNLSGADQSAPFVAIKYANPHSNGFPLWGPSGTGWTIIRRIRPLLRPSISAQDQVGYWAQFWYTDDSSFEDSKTGGKGYIGFHPYPLPPNNNNTCTGPWGWEVASDDGGDFYTTDAAGTADVVLGEWRTQILTVTRAGVNSKTAKFYVAAPSTDAADIVTAAITAASYGENDPPQVNPQLTIGDSPWYGTYQHERASCEHGEIKIIMGALSEADALAEAANMNQLVTSAAQSGIWWGKRGFISIDDLTCDYGTGRAWVWADTGNKGSLGGPL